MIVKIIRTFSIFILLGILLSSCSSSGTAQKTGGVTSEVVTRSDKGVVVSALYIDRKALYDTYGNRNNPFFEYQSNPLIVFGFSVKSKTAVNLRLSKVKIEFLGLEDRPLSRVELTSYWETRLRKKNHPSGSLSSRHRGWSYNTISKIIEGSVVPDVLSLDAQDELKGLLLFTGLRNRHGTATIRVPVYDTAGKKIHEFILQLYV
jgi:predicted acetyltransferase